MDCRCSPGPWGWDQWTSDGPWTWHSCHRGCACRSCDSGCRSRCGTASAICLICWNGLWFWGQLFAGDDRFLPKTCGIPRFHNQKGRLARRNMENYSLTTVHLRSTENDSRTSSFEMDLYYSSHFSNHKVGSRYSIMLCGGLSRRRCGGPGCAASSFSIVRCLLFCFLKGAGTWSRGLWHPS